MTFRKWFKFGKLYGSDVKQMVLIVVLLSIFGNLPLACRGQYDDREARKLFGGYRITPTYCKAARAAKFNRGNTICMFNHECAQRGGEVVGTCMDGFLFGACCQLKSDSQSHIPKGPGVVMTSYLDYPDAELETDDYEADQLNSWHNSFKPVVTPGYKPASQSTLSTAKPDDLSTEAEMINEGVNQITNTLLSTPPKDSAILFIKPKPEFPHSTIDHGGPDTILVHTNGSIVDTIVRPSDFNIQVSSMQTKPTVPPITTTTTQKTVSTHRPVKPVFRPKPTKATTENYVMISTVTKETHKVTEVSPIDSIIQMLNESTPSLKEDVTSPGYLDILETKSSPSPITVSPSYGNTYPSTGHYVTLKPFSSTSYTKQPSTKKPYIDYTYVHTSSNTVPEYSSPNPSQSSQAMEAFNKYPTDPNDFGDLTTFSYVSSSTTPKPVLTTRKPPSTSYVTGSHITRRPVTPSSPILSSYDVEPDSFSSVTPTVIVLNGFQTAKPELAEETQFVEISQEPFKKPVSTITVNNNIASTNNIYMGKPPTTMNDERPSSPTVIITPKPAPVTSPFPNKSSTRPVPSTSPTPLYESYTDYAPTTLKPELQTSPDDSINFPPVRNPLLNATGANPALFNTSISISDNELSDIDLIHELEFTTPVWQENDELKQKMGVFVNKIVGSLQGTFQELHDIVILDKKVNVTTTPKPKRTLATTKKPTLSTRKPPPTRPTLPTRPTTTTKRPVTVKTTRKPVRLTTPVRRTTTSAPPVTTTKKTVTTTKKVKPSTTKKAKPTTTQAATPTTELDEATTENYVDQPIDYNDRNLCGVRPLVKSGRIVGGKNARFGEWPWQVLVRESTWLGLFVKNKCGGVLITNRFVTTAAHCQPGFLASLLAVFGENDVSNDKEPKVPVSRNVRRVIVHREYNAATFENDLALLELETPIKFDAHIVPICMPSDNVEYDFTGRMATVTGWGRLKYGGGVPAVLQEVEVPVIENSACQEMFNTAGQPKKILDSFICAGYATGRKDSCEGDSGGPLVLQRDDGRWQLIGTVSHGVKCAAPLLPGVYMRTTYYKPWLKSITGLR